MIDGEKDDATATIEKYSSTSTCFACGPDNPRGLHLEFKMNENEEMAAEWTPDPDLEGYPGIIHGGVISTVLDEAMAKIVAAKGARALTVDLRVRFRRTIVSRETVVISGWIASSNRHMIRAEAKLTAGDGSELAHGWGTFLGSK
jgi:acyl-coenzyme A thioesterase PaaI-like protein